MSEELYFATVGTVYEDGVSLIFDGVEEESQKHYKVNTSIVFQPGDRVKILPYNGTYVVEYVVGSPLHQKETLSDNGLPAGGAAGQVLVKASEMDYATNWKTLPNNGLPSGGSAGQFLVKISGSNYAAQWQTLRNGLPSGGSAGQVLVKKSGDNYNVGWSSVSAANVINQASTGQRIYFRYTGGKFQVSINNSQWYSLATS